MDELYAAPDSNLSRTDANIEQILVPLLETRFWVRLCSIIGFIFTFFIVLGAIGIFAGSSALNSLGGAYNMGFGAGMVIAYILMALFFFVPSYYLFKYARAISTAESSRSSEDLCEALRYQKSFWKFVGVLVLLYLIIIIFAVVIGILSAF